MKRMKLKFMWMGGMGGMSLCSGCSEDEKSGNGEGGVGDGYC